jgi:hypothetical protein
VVEAYPRWSSSRSYGKRGRKFGKKKGLGEESLSVALAGACYSRHSALASAEVCDGNTADSA